MAERAMRGLPVLFMRWSLMTPPSVSPIMQAKNMPDEKSAECFRSKL